MKRYQYDPETSDGWKSYPIRLIAPRRSHCCGRAMLIVQSKEGGFVTADCSKCNRQTTLSEGEFKALNVWVGCPECNSRMLPDLVPASSQREINYGFKCEHCDLYIWFSDLLPHWEDVFPAVNGSGRKVK